VRLTPEPCQNVRREDRDSSTGSDACQSPFCTRFSVRELISADNDCNKACNFSYRPGEEVLKSLESCIERRPLRMSGQRK